MKPTVYLKNKVLNFLNSRGYQLIKDSELEDKMSYFKNVLKESKKKELNDEIDSIIFSKDRAMQLHAFLTSYIDKVKNRGTLYILYTTSDNRYAKSYKELMNLFKGEDFIFIKESDFREQLIGICSDSKAKIIGFYVDDMIFVQDIDYNHILDYDTLEHVVSIGRGQDLDYNIVLSKPNKTPQFTKVNNGFYKFRWDFINEKNDFTYPLGVGGYFYGKEEVSVMLNGIQFKAPNSLEISLQSFKPYFIHRFGVCKKHTVSVAVHANIVQTEGYNPVLGTFTLDELLKLWEDGFMINLSKFYEVNGAVAQVQKYEFIKRPK